MATPDYDLHKLGWRAFQDLCAVVLQEVLGQTFTAFADTNDAGQDGAFNGSWATPGDISGNDLRGFAARDMPVVVQCKFSVEPSGTLTPSDLVQELDKVEALHERGLCDGYLVLTNLRVTGRTRAWFEEEVRKRGPQHAVILPGSWICTQIEKNWNLRRYVPRVYGLGDLTSILDDRRMRQARALLTSLTRELETFVPTGAYRDASDALTDHGFVLLLGEPACGKSTIAAMLCMTALDHWGCDVMRVDGPADLLEHWNPDDPRQMFWVDDAFGSIRHEPHLTDAWARRMQEVMAAVGHGARVLMTSRDYIYREARPRLKEYVFPRLREQQVVIDVTALTRDEKQQMLYNHLKAGDQPAEVLDGWRPHLQAVADSARFQPEIARRLSLQGFMPPDGLDGEAALLRFVEHPSEFLVDILSGLEPAQRATLAAVYLAGGQLPAPFAPDERTIAAITELGTTVADTTIAFAAIEGTFLTRATDTHGDPVWRFHHPTMREGFAAAVAGDIATLTVYIEGMTTDEIVAQLDCGGAAQRGTLVRVPPALYPLVVPRVPVPNDREWSGSPTAWFLRTRCSDEFLRLWAEANAEALPGIAEFGMLMDAMWEPAVLARLNQAGALPEEIRVEAIARVTEFGIEDFDPGWADPNLRGLFNNDEYAHLLRRVRSEVVDSLESRIDEHVSSIYGGLSKAELYQTPRDYVDAIRSTFADNNDVLQLCTYAENYISDREVEDDDGRYTPAAGSGLAAPKQAEPTDTHGRDPFEDVAAGH